MKPDASVHLIPTLRKRLQDSDKQAAIELYYELLSSGHSVGEILKVANSIQCKAGHSDTVTAEYPQSKLSRAPTDAAAEVASADGAQVNAPYADNRRTKEPPAADSAPLDEVGSNERERLCRESLIRAEPDVTGSKGAHTSSSHEISVHADDQEQLRPGLGISKRRRFAAVYTGIIASVTVIGFSTLSILHNSPDAESIVTRVQSNVLRGTESVANPDTTANRPEGVAEALSSSREQVVNAPALQALEVSKPGEPDLAVSGPLQTTTAAVRMEVSATLQEVEASQAFETGTVGVIELSNPAPALSAEPAHHSIPWVTQYSSAAPSGAAEAAPSSNTEWRQAGEPPEAAEAASPNAAVDLEPSSTAPTHVANTADNSEPARTQPAESSTAVTSPPSRAEAIESGPEAPDIAITAKSETKHRLGVAARGITDVASQSEIALAKQPDILLPPGPETVTAIPAPRTLEVAREKQRFTNVEADALLTRGDAFFAAGDLASARTFYEYAVAAGSSAAALRLGSTFDPDFLARARVGRIQGDLPSALYWYRRARDLGSRDAEVLLRIMENTAR